jgi:hypothetical protein
MRFALCCCLLSSLFACSTPSQKIGFQGGFDSVELATTSKAPPKSSPTSSRDGVKVKSLTESLLGISLAALDAGIFTGGNVPPIAYNEVRMLVARERSSDFRAEVLGLGAELSLAITPQVFTRLGFWVLEGEDLGSVDGAEVGRFTFGLGHAIPLSESTHLVGSVGFEWERDRASSVNFFSLSHSSDDGLFGSNESEFGFDADIALRHRLNSWLEIDGGIRGETQRKDSAGAFGNLRLFITPNVAVFFSYEDVDEATARLGISLIGG